MTVLVVSRSDRLVESIRDYMEGIGYVCLTARDGDEARWVLSVTRVHQVIVETEEGWRIPAFAASLSRGVPEVETDVG